AYDCDGAEISNNTVSGARDHGFYLPCCINGVMSDNDFYYSGNDGNIYGFFAPGAENLLFERNTILIDNVNGEDWSWAAFRYGNKNIYIRNRISLIHTNSGASSAFQYINNSSLTNNHIEIASRNNDTDWSAFHGSNNISENDTLILGQDTRGYYGSGWTIKGSVIKSPASNSGYEAIYCTGGTLEVSDLIIENCHRGIYGSGAGGSVRQSFIKVYGSEYGLKFESNSNMNLYQNTIIGKGGGTGIASTSNATLKTNSNLIYGFTTGISAESPNSIQTSLLFNNTNSFRGAELPAQVGQVVTVNGNATPSDIYGNIFIDPQFVDGANGNYRLMFNSPAINAGDIDSLDVDGTIADIGAFIYNFGFVPCNLAVDSTGNGWVAFSWEISETDSLQSFIPYYKLSSSSNWTPVSNVTTNSTMISGLTNNVNYDFCVAAVYPSKSSNLSKQVTAKPGIAIMEISPRCITIFQQPGDMTVQNIAFTNNGTKDLIFTLTGVVNSGILSNSTGVVTPGAMVVVTDTLRGSSIGVRTGNILVTVNNYINPLDSICILQVVGTYTSLNPVKFTPPSSVENKFYIVLESAYIDGSSLQTGDEVGIFDGDECVGAGGFNGAFPMVITCYGAESGAPGFAAGDSIIVKLYDASQARYANVTSVNYSFGSGYFVDSGFAKASLQGSVYQSFNIPLIANRFNLISSYLFPRYPNATTLFSTVPGLKIAYEDNGSAYIPQYNINTIGDLDISEGYHLFVAETDRILTISGLTIDPQNFSLTLAHNRFNSIGYLYYEPMEVTAVFAEITDNISIVQDDDGGVWIPELNINTLGTLNPGQGYQLFCDADDDIIFLYPEYDPMLAKRFAVVQKNQSEPNHFHYTKTGLPYNIIINSTTMDGQQLADGDEIGVFWNELCVGAVVYQHDQATVLSSWKGDDKLGIIGYKAGDGIRFKAFSQRFKQEFELSAQFARPEQSRFEEAAYAVVNLQGRPGLIPERYALKQNYPNPFNNRTIIPYDVPQEADVSLVIYDLLGKEVVRLKDHHFHQPGKYRFEWNGLDRNGLELSSGVYFVRMISSDYQKVQKLVLMK
ncbi:MAG: T9SS type A sorting domain-containing protein, partial [Candidatus Marinimicrobia bacterium]|nr:T9SS type A sorting domain-containing protein [Candidatus Neomarinimicrobiota bacterium]